MNLSPRHPQLFVDILLIKISVGKVQRREIEEWRGFQRVSCDYNEVPNKQLPNVLLEGASVFRRAFFLAHSLARANKRASRYGLTQNRLRRFFFVSDPTYGNCSKHGSHQKLFDNRPH